MSSCPAPAGPGSQSPAPSIFYLAPHADDVVLSCAGHVAGEVAQGRAVTLITVFLSGRTAEQRRAEDERAAAVLGCRYLCLSLFDAAERPEIRGRLGVFTAFGPPHLGITSEVVARLRWHIQAPAELCAPLAVGGHIDHRIVHEAARALAYELRLPLAYYEDQPYSLAAYALGRRLAALETELGAELPGTGRATPGRERRAYSDFFRELPLLQSLPPGVRRLGGYLLGRAALRADRGGQRPGPPPRLRPQLREISAQRPARLAAIAAYASQWPQFAASPEALEERLYRYGQALQAGSAPAGRGDGSADRAPSSVTTEAPASYERLWRDHGIWR